MISLKCMYSKVSICKTCFRKVLDEQLKIEPEGLCIYCLITLLRYKVQDLDFANQLLTHHLDEIEKAYQDYFNKQMKD
jgi:hypothetical protein